MCVLNISFNPNLNLHKPKVEWVWGYANIEGAKAKYELVYHTEIFSNLSVSYQGQKLKIGADGKRTKLVLDSVYNAYNANTWYPNGTLYKLPLLSNIPTEPRDVNMYILLSPTQPF